MNNTIIVKQQCFYYITGNQTKVTILTEITVQKWHGFYTIIIFKYFYIRHAYYSKVLLITGKVYSIECHVCYYRTISFYSLSALCIMHHDLKLWISTSMRSYQPLRTILEILMSRWIQAHLLEVKLVYEEVNKHP